MLVRIYENNNDKNVINKTKNLYEIKQYSCYPFEDFSITNPVVILDFEDYDITNFNRANYAYIPACNRFYFIDNISIINKNRMKINMSVDVLMSFKNGILKTSQQIIRNSDKNLQNAYLKDNLMQLNSYTKYAVYNATNPTGGAPLDSTPTGHCFVFNSL